MKKNYPLVSIIMPVYNAGNFLVEAVESLREQTYKNWELIAVDDGSSDDSYKILREFSRKDKRIRVRKNKGNLGVSITANKAISKCRGEFIARMDADDVSFPSRLESQVKYLLRHPEVIIVGGQMDVIDSEGRITGKLRYTNDWKELYKMLFSSMPVAQPAMMINRSLLPKDFSWYENKYRTAEDTDLMFRLVMFGRLANLRGKVLKYRVHGKNTSLVDTKKTFYITFRTRIKAILKYGYKPTFDGLIISLVQFVVVALVPEKYIYSFYSFFRGIKKPKLGFDNIKLDFLFR